MRKAIVLGAILFGVTALGSLFAAGALPEGGARAARLAAGKSFAPVCEGDGDSRPDPAWVGASYAGDGCLAPPVPAWLDGHVASREQVVAAMAATQRYIARSQG